MSRSRRPRRHVLSWCLPVVVAAAVAGLVVARSGGAIAVRTTADSAGSLNASYQAVTTWDDGYTGQYTITNSGTAGVQLAAVNVMAMDYGDGAAPNPAGQMGSYAIDAATATDAQVASALGISDAAAWSKIAVTPMIGVNDTSDEIFTVANAQQLATFAASKHLAWLSMWSAARDTECPGGALSYASPTCSSIVQAPDAFAAALGAY